jgi:hypothetical protein
MRKTHLIFCFLLLTLGAIAQKKSGTKTDKISSDTFLLPSTAFDKMITQDITYTIFGESSPVSGIKLDISKPEATISGVFQSKKRPWILTGFEFKGGITDKSFSIFKGQNSFNTAFEFRPSIHIIPSWNKAKYCKYEKPVLTAKNNLIQLNTKKAEDTFFVAALIYNAHLENFPELLDETENLPRTQKLILIHLVKRVLKDESLNLDNSSFDNILALVPKAEADKMSSTYIDAIVETYKKYLKTYENRESEELSKQIANVSTAWTQKKYWWFTISPFARTEKITEYHTKYNGLDSLYFKPNYPFYYGINAMINRYRLWPNKVALFWKLGIGLSHANNLTSLSSFNYETTSPFFSYGSTVTTKNKSGTAYNNSDIKSDFLSQLSSEIYLLPLKSFFPGIYVSGSINSSKLYNLPNVVDRENDKILIPIECGFVFNINSREKDKEKSILSISAYFRYEDVTDKRRVSKTNGLEETTDDFTKRNRSFGLKVGIPITLPQRSNQ